MRVGIRIPPNIDDKAVGDFVYKLLSTDVPYNAKVTITPPETGHGWLWKKIEEQDPLMKLITEASQNYFGGLP